MKTITNENSEIYYKGKYWNDIPQIVKFMSKNFTGDENKWWIEDFRERYAKKPFNKALFLNCGDGRWERDFIDRKIVRKAEAFDISGDLIKKAKNLKGKRVIKYFVADVNKVDFDKSSYDLIVNIAALHHTQYINRISRILSKSLKKDGILVNFDYFGPHRNQYPLFNWLLVNIVNKNLTKNIRKPLLGYPHLPTMLATDPTEAIHADLTINCLERYFEILERHDTGGGIAYEIFTHNSKINPKLLNSKKVISQIQKVLIIDKVLTKTRIIPNYFSYIIAKPKKNRPNQINENKIYQKLENTREKYALKLENAYTLMDYLLILRWYGSWRKRVILTIKYIMYTTAEAFEVLSIKLGL